MAHNKQLLLYFCAFGLIGAALGVQESIFNNFLDDTFAITATGRGGLEFPRELPGLLVVVMAGVLCMLPITHLGIVGTLTYAGGLAGLALFGGGWWPMVGMMMLASAGMHLLQPVGHTIVLALSDESKRGRRMGEAGAVRTIGTVAGTAGVWLLLDDAAPQYRMAFLVAAVLGLGACGIYTIMHIPHLHQPRARLVVRRRFSLYYMLEFLFGARKQIFITFGPWVLIQVYKLKAPDIAALLMTGAVIGIVFRPLAGRAIDRFGERAVMVADGLILAVVCLGYGYAAALAPTPRVALALAGTCFVLDNLLFAFGTARSVYLARMADGPQELASSLSMGISINHIASMTLPFVAGKIWEGLGYERVFLAAAVLAVFISLVSWRVPGRKTPEPAHPPVPTPEAEPVPD